MMYKLHLPLIVCIIFTEGLRYGLRFSLTAWLLTSQLSYNLE